MANSIRKHVNKIVRLELIIACNPNARSRLSQPRHSRGDLFHISRLRNQAILSELWRRYHQRAGERTIEHERGNTRGSSSANASLIPSADAREVYFLTVLFLPICREDNCRIEHEARAEEVACESQHCIRKIWEPDKIVLP